MFGRSGQHDGCLEGLSRKRRDSRNQSGCSRDERIDIKNIADPAIERAMPIAFANDPKR